jgi:hypothetical protein
MEHQVLRIQDQDARRQPLIPPGPAAETRMIHLKRRGGAVQPVVNLHLDAARPDDRPLMMETGVIRVGTNLESDAITQTMQNGARPFDFFRVDQKVEIVHGSKRRVRIDREGQVRALEQDGPHPVPLEPRSHRGDVLSQGPIPQGGVDIDIVQPAPENGRRQVTEPVDSLIQ